MGELLRRYWHPVNKSDKLDDVPVRIRVLGEDVILFRKPSGEAGAVYPRCIHRGSSAFYGKVTDAGIRCGYHGWTFDTDGSCMDQPCEPSRGGSAFRQPWYPVEERYGLVFVYMGPLDRKPALPRHEALESIPDGWELYADDTNIPSAGAGFMPCNWLQHHENGLDWATSRSFTQSSFAPMLAEASKACPVVPGAGLGLAELIGPQRTDQRDTPPPQAVHHQCRGRVARIDEVLGGQQTPRGERGVDLLGHPRVRHRRIRGRHPDDDVRPLAARGVAPRVSPLGVSATAGSGASQVSVTWTL